MGREGGGRGMRRGRRKGEAGRWREGGTENLLGKQLLNVMVSSSLVPRLICSYQHVGGKKESGYEARYPRAVWNLLSALKVWGSGTVPVDTSSEIALAAQSPPGP